MEKSFWLQRWQTNQIAFHKSDVNPMLVNYLPQMALPQGGRIFLPLCGKTLDIPWLLSEGYQVVGVELVELAVEQLFEQIGVEPNRSRLGEVSLYQAAHLDIWVGDIFEVSRDRLGAVDGIYDRAALVALPPQVRPHYAAHLMDITDTAPQLLVTYEYDQTVIDGPPFSVSSEEVKQHYGDRYLVSLLTRQAVVGGLRGRSGVQETAWLLRPQS